jgi:hypothetical protein
MITVTFLKKKTELIMRYEPQQGREDWLLGPLEKDKAISISSRTFFVSKAIYRQNYEDLDFTMDACYHFIVGGREGEYYRIDRSVLGIKFDLFMHRSMRFERRTFVAERNISIFRPLHKFGITNLWIGGDHPEAIPLEAFEHLLEKFPNSYELDRYASARVGAIIRNHLPIIRDTEAEYRKYMRKKESRIGSQPQEFFAFYESEKYSELISKIESMLGDSDSYTEKQWQVEILQIIQFLFPKYIKAFPEAPVRDSLSNKNRSIDFLLIDASGYVDAIEIKKPFADCVVTKNQYRDNHVPMRELSGTIMQLEKYLFHLNRWGQQGEKKLNEHYAGALTRGLEIRIVNPSGLIIMGRDNEWTKDQRMDFEVIRRKYRHVVEIMTYDDLLRRLKTIRDQFASVQSAPAKPTNPTTLP